MNQAKDKLTDTQQTKSTQGKKGVVKKKPFVKPLLIRHETLPEVTTAMLGSLGGMP